MSTPPRSFTSRAPEQHPSDDLLSSSPHREATARLLSSSPSIPSYFGKPASRGSSVNGDNHTPSTSWRSPSTLQNYRSANDHSADGTGASNRTGLDSSSNSIHGSYTGPGQNESGNSVVDIPADEASRVVKKHLVINSPSGTSFESDRGGPSNSHDGPGPAEHVDYTSAFKLPGGAITRDVYKWQADQENEQNRRARSRSFHLPRPVEPAASALKQPGGMRRYHMIMKAEALGRQPNVFTKSFIDFLAMYGHFAGEDLDDEEGGDFEPAVYDEEDGQEGGPGSSSRRTETTPLIPKQPPQGDATPAKAVFLLLKSFVGTGIMFLPKAFNNGGLLFSSVVLVAIATISLFSFLLLVESRQVVPASFGDIGGHLYGKWMRQAVLWSIAISQIGFVCAYMSFVATNLEALAKNFVPPHEMYPFYFFVLIQLVVFIPLCLIRNIARLSFTAVIADAFICFGLIYLYYYDFFTLATFGLSDVIMFNPKDFTLFIGTAVFTFEGIGLVIPITEAMKEPEKFPKVLTGVMIGITILFTSAGALSYAAFGSSTQAVVLLNLPQKSHWVQSVQGLYSIAIMLSIPLQLFPAVRIMENGIFTRSGKYNMLVKWQKNFFRVLILFVCALISIYAGPNLDKFVSFVGSVACIPLAYIFPAMFHYKTHPNRNTQIFDILIIVFGVVTMVYSTYNTVLEWIAA
ncbi:transmembrane amino acid transporter protein-domain-containing protein [Mortierella sp. GBAus27b]|nr:neutral amino acid transporter [Mortierella sp. GBA43]KAI8345642.1 transmembrane amino acid transporter protein-domain-containing protein [Mortierella sp. GBAus27b]